MEAALQIIATTKIKTKPRAYELGCPGDVMVDDDGVR
jgi:hypothetical protein